LKNSDNNATNQLESVDMSNLLRGLYFAKVYSNDEVYTEKIIKK